MNKKISFVISDISGKGGTERMTAIIANALSEKNFDVSILSIIKYENINYYINKNIKLSYILENKLGNTGKYFPKVALNIKKFIVDNKVDIVINVESMLFLFVFYAKLTTNVKTICWEHFNYNVSLGKPFRKIARIIAAIFSDSIVTLTKKDCDLWQAKWFTKSKVITINNPVESISKSIDPDLFQRKTFLAVGRVVPQKGFDRLVKIWQKVYQELPDWKLVIVGEGEDKDSLIQYVETHKIKNITFFPFTKDIKKYYDTSSILLVTSRFEGFSLVLAESGSHGLPCISYDCEQGPAEIILNNITGYLIENGNENLFLEKLKYIAVRPDLVRTFSINALKRSECFSLDKIVNDWLTLIKKI